MTSRRATKLFVDSDNALGASRGDIDDGIALAVLLKSGIEIEAIGSIFGNTTQDLAQRDNQQLAALAGFEGPCLAGAATPRDEGSEAATHLAHHTRADTLLALGPLTNLAHALARGAELGRSGRHVVCLGSNATSRGRWPPVWPFEFNFTKDRGALGRVFDSDLELSIVPLDQACRMRIRFGDLGAIRGELGAYLRRHARRWFRRARWLKQRSTVPVWDLVAATYVLQPELFRCETVAARAHARGWVEYGAGSRRVTRVVDFAPDQVWEHAVATLNANGTALRPGRAVSGPAAESPATPSPAAIRSREGRPRL